MKKKDLPIAIFLMGPTASGKTILAIKLRKVLPVELISVDSALIYRGMNIGTSKPNAEELKETPHRLVDILDPSQEYSAANFRCDALKAMADITMSGRIPLLVGGTMFYFNALLKGLSPLPSANHKIRSEIKQKFEKLGCGALHQHLLKIDPVAAIRIHPNDFQRLSRALEVFSLLGKTITEMIKIKGDPFPYRVYQFAIAPINRELLHQRIKQRFYRILNSGFQSEVQALFSRKDLNKNMPSMRCIGYRQMWSYINREISYDKMVDQSICATKQLAKRQMTWLKKWNEIRWLDSEKPQKSLQEIHKFISFI